MQVDDQTADGGSSPVTTDPCNTKDSSLKHAPQKKKIESAGTRRISVSPKVALIPKAKQGKKITTNIMAKTTQFVIKLVSNENANSSPDGETLKVLLIFRCLLLFYFY